MRPWFLLLLPLLACGNESSKPTASGSKPGTTGTATGTGTGTATGTATGTGTGTGTASLTCDALGGLGALHNGQVFPNIQAAIDDAQGSTQWVYICPGTYAEPLTVPSDRRIQGVGGSTAVTLAGNGVDPVVGILSGTVTLQGLTITGGGGATGGGVNGQLADDLTLEDCVITGNTGDNGAGVMVGNTATISNSDISGNVAVQYAGGLGVDDSASVILDQVTINANSAGDLGGGIFAWNGATITGTGVTIDGNDADSGGGVYLWQADASGLDVTGNTVLAAGGAIYVYEGGSLSNITASGNAAERGGGLAANLGLLDLDTITVDGNSATTQGGGLHFDQVMVTTNALSVTGNTCDDLGGGAYVRDTDWTGGVVDGNTAVTGGGIYVSSFSLVDVLDAIDITGNSVTESGGGVANLSADLTASNLVVTGNTSDNRGGGFYNSNSTLLDLSNSTISGNSAISYGGGLYLNTASSGTVTDTAIDANLCERGAGMYINAASSLVMTNGSIVGNGDGYTVSGGGIRIQEGTADLTSVDLGGGPDENDPDDIYCLSGPASYLGYGAGTTTACDEFACSPVP